MAFPLFKAGRLLRGPARETDTFVRRAWFATFGMLVLMCALVGRLVYLQLVHHDHYTTLSQENRLKIIPVPPTRGLIYSRDGVLLADNRPSFALEVIPEQSGDLERAITAIRQYIALDEDQIERLNFLGDPTHPNWRGRIALFEAEIARVREARAAGRIAAPPPDLRGA